MSKKTTHAILVLDRSGSMSDCRQATIDGYNEQLNALRASEGKVFVTCIQFDTELSGLAIETMYERAKAKDAPDLTEETYVPRGMTPMLDAVGRAIAVADTDGKSDSILVMTVSDGFENASREETWVTIAEKIKERTARGNWTFGYIGANQDLSDVSKRMNIPLGNTLNYAADPHGTRAAYTASGMASVGLTQAAARSTKTLFAGNGSSQ